MIGKKMKVTVYSTYNILRRKNCILSRYTPFCEYASILGLCYLAETIHII